MCRALPIFVTTIVVFSLSLPVLGQPAGDKPTTSAADEAAARAARSKELNKQGIAMLDAGDLERALDYFLQSRQALPTTKNTTNTAIVLERLGRFDEALELYEELLLKYAGGLEEEDRAAIAPAMTELRPKVGSVAVTSNTGGRVQIDGRDRGVLPLSGPIRVMPGKHTVRVIKVGHHNFETTVEVAAAASMSVDAKLTPVDGVGTLQVVDTGGVVTDVYVDGTKLGETPFEGALPAGKHLVWLQRGDTGSMPTWVQVIAGQTAITPLQSRPLGPRVELHVEPSTAMLNVGGLAVGKAQWSGRLPAGPYEIRASEPGYRTVVKRIDAPAGGAPIDLTVRLEIDPEHPRWPREGGKFLAELVAGGMVGPSLNGGATDNCPDACPSHSPAYGFQVGARGGYRFRQGVAIEFGGGYMRLMEAVDRTESSSFTTPNPAEPDEDVTTPVNYALTDAVLVHGPYAAAGVSYRHTLGMLHLGTRATLGVLVTISRDEVEGTAATSGPSVPVFVEKGDETVISAAPFLAPELNAGLALGPVDLGLSLAAAFFPALGPEIERGRFGPTTSEGVADPTAVENAPESDTIEGERAYGRFVVFAPAITLGADF